MLGLFSCEYPLDEDNFVEVKKPSDFPVVTILFNGGIDTVRISDITQVHYNLATTGQGTFFGEFRLQDQSWRIDSKEGDIYLDPARLSIGYDTLVLELRFPTNSGSIAGNLNQEFYIEKKKWVAIIDNSLAEPISPVASTTPQGYLKLSWPRCEQYNFMNYTIHVADSYGYFNTVLISNRDHNYFVDSCFIGGNISYSIYSRIYGSSQQNYGTGAVITEAKPVLNFTETSPDSVRITWNKMRPHALYKLFENENILLLEHTGVNSLTVAAPGFGKWTQYQLSAASTCVNNCESGYVMNADMVNYGLGTYLLPNWPRYAYNRNEKIVYSSKYDNVIGFDATTQNIVNTVSLKNVIYGGLCSSPTNSSQMAITTDQSIVVYNDKTLQNPLIIPENSAVSLDHLLLTDNGIIATAQGGVYRQVRLSDLQEIVNIPYSNYPVGSKWACISTSKSGQYADIVGYAGKSLYHIADNAATLVYSDSRSYRSTLFNENNEQLFQTFTGNNTLEIRNAANYALIRSITLPVINLVLCNVDPVTGFLLLTDYEYMYVIDLETSRLKVRLKSIDFIPRLYNNFIYGHCGRTFDISKFYRK